RAKGLATTDIHIAVLIQRMVQPIASGVAFTVNPVTGASNEVVINSSWGVGEALVSGQVDPDEFVLRKKDCGLLWSRIGEKGLAAQQKTSSMSMDQLRELTEIAVRIERHFGTPQDVEWCHDGTGFWIVQSRPITAATAVVGEIEWTRANLVEVLPDITSPQALLAYEEVLDKAERRSMGKLAAPEEVLGPMVK